jgi:hypothetical protein
MTFPSGGPGYPQQHSGGAQPNPSAPGPGGFPQQQQSPVAPLSAANLNMLLALAVTLLGVVSYFVSFSDQAAPADTAVTYLLIGGLLAALRVLPASPKAQPFVALASVVGALEAILATVRSPAGAAGTVTVIMILGILQMLVAVAILLVEYGLLKLPTPQPPAYGQQPYGQFRQPAQGPAEQKAGPSGTQFGPPVTPPGQQTPQSTVYAPQQGQFFQPPQPSESGQQQPQQNPGNEGQQS